jgi:hypothetical protein
VGRLTEGFPLVVDINPLPDGFPATGFTWSFWDRGQDADDATDLAEAAYHRGRWRRRHSGNRQWY